MQGVKMTNGTVSPTNTERVGHYMHGRYFPCGIFFPWPIVQKYVFSWKFFDKIETR